MVHARLGIAEENSGKLVSLVRREAQKIAEEKELEFILTDGPPGIGCPVIASIGGASGVLIVTEPSVSGKHDMTRVADLAAHFGVPAMVCVNKFDINPDATRDIEKYSIERNLPVVGRIPFDPVFVQSMVQGQTLFEYKSGSKTGQAVEAVWRRVAAEMKMG
jgi:MinD superfamily P-loop ATPase